jgi:uncharacterized protein DUF2613
LTGKEEPAMSGLTIAAASIAVGLSMGAVATVGVTLAVQGNDAVPTPSPPVTRSPGPYLVDYGGRVPNLPCNSVRGCLNQIPGLPHF